MAESTCMALDVSSVTCRLNAGDLNETNFVFHFYLLLCVKFVILSCNIYRLFAWLTQPDCIVSSC